METYIAFLRGINVGGSNILPMSELKSICNDIGFEIVRTYIQSGNVIFESKIPEVILVKELEDALYKRKQKHIPVIIRTAKELESVLFDNPFPNAKASQVGVMFFTDPIPKDALNGITIPGSEIIEIHEREIYIYFPNGMGSSKLKFTSILQKGTVRNINSVAKLVELSRGE